MHNSWFIASAEVLKSIPNKKCIEVTENYFRIAWKKFKAF